MVSAGIFSKQNFVLVNTISQYILVMLLVFIYLYIIKSIVFHIIYGVFIIISVLKVVEEMASSPPED